MKFALALRFGWLPAGYNPDFFTHWFDLWFVGFGVTWTRTHIDSRKLKNALKKLRHEERKDDRE